MDIIKYFNIDTSPLRLVDDNGHCYTILGKNRNRFGAQALEFIQHEKWFDGYIRMHYGKGVEDVIELYFIEFAPNKKCPFPGAWVISGDCPNTYLDIVNFKTCEQALMGYCRHLEFWLYKFRNKLPLLNTFPHFYPGTRRQVRPDEQYFDYIESVISMIRSNLSQGSYSGMAYF